MTRSFWYVITVLILVCFSGIAVDWLDQPPAVYAMAAGPAGDRAEREAGAAANEPSTAAAQPAQPVTGASPVVQGMVALVVVLFGILAFGPFLWCSGEPAQSIPPAPPVRR